MPGSFQDDHLAGMIRLQHNGEKHLIGKTVEVNGQRKDGRMIPLEISLAEWQVNSDKFYTAIIRDITERKHLENELQQRATTDELTGIANRRYLLELAHREIKRAVRSKNPLAIALIDIDRFKHINDTYGHAAGDLALTAFTKICQRNIREIDVFARFGGDEFALLLPDTNCEQAYLVVERARQAIAAQTMEFEGQSFSINISAGIASLSDAPETFDTLLSRADRALYRAKEEGRNTVMTCADV
jgi:diguanylate cyclase (GGDEF)-like protein